MKWPGSLNITLREKYPYSEFFWFVFSSIRTEYRETRNISQYSVLMRENTDQKNSKHKHILHSVSHADKPKKIY